MGFLKKFKFFNEQMQKAETKTKIGPTLSIQVSFDRSNPTVKLFDNASNIELREKDCEALLKWLTTTPK